MNSTFYEEIGGMDTVGKVHSLLYERLLSHSWLKQFFDGFERWHLEIQQNEFMADLFGRTPRNYAGRAPMRAHQHMFISEEIFMIRHSLLQESISAAGLSDEIAKRWLEYDLSMKPALVKETVDDCEGRFPTEEIVICPKP